MSGLDNSFDYTTALSGMTPNAVGLNPLGSFDQMTQSNGTTPNMPMGLGKLDLGQKLGLGVQGLSTVAGLVMGLKQLGLANKQFNFQKQFATTNLANQVKSYNTALSDRLRSRAVMESGSTAGSDQAIAANSLKTSY